MNTKFRIFLFLILFGALSSIVIGFSILVEQKNREDKKGSGVVNSENRSADIKHAPYVVNLPPVSVNVGERFEHRMVINDQDTSLNAVSANLVEGPPWLTFKDKFLLGGVPESTLEGNVKVVVQISDGDNTVREEFYLIVSENNE